MEPLTLLVGVVIFLAGTFFGRSMRRKPPKPPALDCGCGHNYGAHQAGNRCMSGIKTANRWSYDSYNKITTPTNWHYPPCPCQYYDGPEPLPRTWSPELMRGIGEIKND